MKKIRFIALLIVLCMLLGACAKDNNAASEKEQKDKIQTLDNNASQDDKKDDAGKTESGADTGEDKATAPVIKNGSGYTFEELGAMVPAGAELKKLSIDTDTTFQTIDGFGAAYTWYAERIFMTPDPSEAFDEFFTDAGFSIMRFKNEYEYSRDDRAENAVTIAKYYKEARERAALRGERIQVLLCCWSPPAFLKSDNTIHTGSGTLKKNEDGSYCYDEYAAWWTEAVAYYRSFGIQIDYVSIQNEVDFAPADYEGCLFGPKETSSKAGYAQAFLAVYRAFKEAFGDSAPKLIAPETMSCKLFDLKQYTDPIIAEEPDSIYARGYHLYVGGDSNSSTMTVNPGSYTTNFDQLASTFTDYKLWQTEFYIGHGLQTATLISNALTRANMNAYIYWSGVWDDSTPNKFESADLMEVTGAGKWRMTANYYALRHFSEFIRPGYIRVKTLTGNVKVQASAFVSEYRDKMAVVMINNSEEPVYYCIDSDNYTITDSMIYCSVFGSGDASPENMYKQTGSINGPIEIPAYSVITIDITGYEGESAPAVPAKEKIVYTDEVITEFKVEKPVEDTILLEKSFEDKLDVNKFSAMGSSSGVYVEGKGVDQSGCMQVKGRAADWNGVTISTGYFENYGCLLYVSYDVMMEEAGNLVSCTSTFTTPEGTFYPDVENTRVTCQIDEAGKWYHVEGYITMFANMDAGSFRIYWESAGNTSDIYLDNVSVKALYSMPAGDYESN